MRSPVEGPVRLLGRGLIASLMLVCVGAAGCFPERPGYHDGPEGRELAPEVEVEVEVDPAAASTPAPRIEPVPLIEVEIPEPEPPAFAGREAVRVDELLEAVRAEVPRLATSETILADYASFRERFELEHDEELLLDYVRIKLAFEATRDGGWWGLHWDITNEQPNSEQIWAAWRALELDGPAPASAPSSAAELRVPEVTAIAECDELSALFAFVAQRIGLSRESEVGLFWPTGNHVVAVWTIHARSKRPVRVVVPTSQIFLSDEDTLGTAGFDPWRQKTIFDYRRQDAAASSTIPGPLASAFVQAIRDHGHRSQAELQAARNGKRERQSRSLAEKLELP